MLDLHLIAFIILFASIFVQSLEMRTASSHAGHTDYFHARERKAMIFFVARRNEFPENISR